jgi:hypothetical protein
MRALGIAALCLSGFAAVAPAFGRPQESARRGRPMRPAPSGAKTDEDWQRRLQGVSADLRRGAWPVAREKSRVLVRDLCERRADGEGVALQLARAVLLRGLAAVGTGDREAGLWDWYMAQSLSADVSQTDFAPYGAPGRLLASYRLAGGERPTAANALSPTSPSSDVVLHPPARPKPTPNLTKPSLRRRVEPTSPPALRGRCRKGEIAVEFVIETSGAVSFPIVMHPAESPDLPAQSLVLTLAALEALHVWRYEPAKLSGEVVRLLYAATVPYETEGCARRR